jgi:hypothetical protein
VLRNTNVVIINQLRSCFLLLVLWTTMPADSLQREMERERTQEQRQGRQGRQGRRANTALPLLLLSAVALLGLGLGLGPLALLALLALLVLLVLLVLLAHLVLLALFSSPACSRRSRCASGDPKPLPHLRRRRALQQTTEERHNRLSLREKTRPCLSNKPMCFSPLSLPAAGRAGGPLACLQGMARISRQAFFPRAPQASADG